MICHSLVSNPQNLGPIRLLVPFETYAIPNLFKNEVAGEEDEFVRFVIIKSSPITAKRDVLYQVH